MTATEHNTLHVRPVEGARVLDPVTFAAVPEAGRQVPNTSYWRRRINQGQLELVPSATEKTDKPLIKTKKNPKADTGATA